MNVSTAINELATALAKAQADIANPSKNQKNSHFGNSYADLSAVLAVVRSAFPPHGLSFIQTTEMVDEKLYLNTTLLHGSGQFMSSLYPVTPTKNDAQGVGAAVTYARRYSLAAFAGISQEDDDGESAVGRGANGNSNKPVDRPREVRKDDDRPRPEARRDDDRGPVAVKPARVVPRENTPVTKQNTPVTKPKSYSNNAQSTPQVIKRDFAAAAERVAKAHSDDPGFEMDEIHAVLGDEEIVEQAPGQTLDEQIEAAVVEGRIGDVVEILKVAFDQARSLEELDEIVAPHKPMLGAFRKAAEGSAKAACVLGVEDAWSFRRNELELGEAA
jgi:hypothetical protein